MGEPKWRMELNKLKKHFETRVVDNKNVHYCNSCQFNTTIQKEMCLHVRKHMKKTFKYECNQINCDQVFKTAQALEEHETNHLCGFGIDGMEESGICGLKNIECYYEMTVQNNEFQYECRWTSCSYVIKRLDCIQRHVHRQHFCPYRKQNHSGSVGSSSRKSQ